MKYIAAMFLFVFSLSTQAKTIQIKLATLAPEGTSGANFLREFDAELRKETKNAVKLKLYMGGVMGDENVVLQKIRAGQLHGAGFTGIGLGQIESFGRMLEMPFLFADYEEIDFVVPKISKTLEGRFKKKGYTVLGWIEVGLVYFFAKKPIDSLSALKSVKMWVWNSDPMAKIMFKEFDINPVPLELPDVPMSLDTGIITACYATPFAALALQWLPRIEFITSQNMAYATGALIVKNKIFNKLSVSQKKTILKLGAKYAGLITQAIRKENAEALIQFKESGKKFVDFNIKEIKSVIEKSRAIRKSLAGKLFSKKFHNKVIKLRNLFRKNKIKTLIIKLNKLKKSKGSADSIKEIETDLNKRKELLKHSKKDLI